MLRSPDVLKKQVLHLMSRSGYTPLRKRKIARKLKLKDDEYPLFRLLLDELVKAGEVAVLPQKTFGLPRHAEATAAHAKSKKTRAATAGINSDKHAKPLPKNAQVGRLEVKRGGFGFLISDPPGNDVFIPHEALGGAISGDLVAVSVKREDKGRRRTKGKTVSTRRSGRVLRILERGHQVIVGTFHDLKGPNRVKSGLGGYVVPDTRGLFQELRIYPEDRGEARDGDKVEIALRERDNDDGLRACVVKVYGPAGSVEAEFFSIVKNFDLRIEFPAEVMQQAEKLEETIPAEELSRRVDFSHPITFTIDPSDAKDHDDAVALRRLDGGQVELLVHIADVSHYVIRDTAIDREARTRGTSVYLPGRVLPMLPEKLSNGVCSLKEGQVRLTKTVAIVFDADYKVQATRLYKSYIRSSAFMHYDQVKDALEKADPSLVPSPEIYRTLCEMRSFAAGLRQRRMDAGSIDLDMPEVRLVLNDAGEVTSYEKAEHHWAHALIEDMMLAANRAVAEYLVAHDVPGLFRIHEEPEPDALEKFANFAHEFELPVRRPITRSVIRSVLERVKGKIYAHAVQLALLTSLKQARYSAESHPHYALNFNRYLHFTSPIRRYPDLIVHRALDACFEEGQSMLVFTGKRKKGPSRAGQTEPLSELYPLADHCSQRERAAAAAEEEMKKFRQIQYLRAHMKESHPGVIKGVRDFGLFVELQDCFVEGMVRIEDLADDYYVYYEQQHLLQGRHTRRSFRLGDRVDVRVGRIDLGTRKVDFLIV